MIWSLERLNREVVMKGLLTVVAVIFVGIVGYKIVKKLSPAIIRGVKRSMAKTGEKVNLAIDDVKESFYEGYVQA